MKSLLALLIALLLLAVPGAHAQVYRTNNMNLPFTLVTAAANSNVIAWGNASGFANAMPYQFQEFVIPPVPYQVIVDFSCPTVTLAATTFVLGFGAETNKFGTSPNSIATIVVPATAANANRTNQIAIYSSTETNLMLRLPPLLPYMTLLSVTNGNAADVTINRIYVRERCP